MSRIPRLLPTALMLGWLAGVAASQRLPDSLVKELLAIPAPPPPTIPDSPAESSSGQAAAGQRFGPPASDAPADILVGYWSNRLGRSDEPPEDRVRERLLAICESSPENLPALLPVLPETPEAMARIKSLLDVEQKMPRFDPRWREAVRRHLTYHSTYFIQDLATAARSAHDDDSMAVGGEDLKVLARLDWTAAQPVLLNHAASKNLRVAAVALALLYSHALSANDGDQAALYRTRLRRIVEDRAQPAHARDSAAEALLSTQWTGRDEWYWSLFHDPTMRGMKDGYEVMSPLCSIAMDQSAWIAQLAQRVKGSERTVRDAAVTCLVGFSIIGEVRRDALEPLLPWLQDPKWSAATDRLRLIQSMDRLEMPESIPGLIAVLDQADAFDRSYAAESLAHYKDPRAVPALKRALARETDNDHRLRIIRALNACGGISDDEAVAALEAFARQMATPHGLEAIHNARGVGASQTIPANVAMGEFLSENPPSDSAIARLLQRAQDLRMREPSVAKPLLAMIEQWPKRSIDEDLLRRIAGGKADATAIHSALVRRESLRQTVRAEVEQMSAGGGWPSGVAAVLMGNSERERSILSGTDTAAQTGLLASARLVREPFDIALVGRLLENPDALVATAAEAYLVMDDSSTARKSVLARHPGEALILGTRETGDPGHDSYSSFDGMEKQLAEEARSGTEIYALLTAGYWGDAGQIVLRVSGESAELRYFNDPARYHVRVLKPEELRELRDYIAASAIEDRGPLSIQVSDGMQYEYVHVSSAGGRRVFMNNPGMVGTGGSVYDRTCQYFSKLLAKGSLDLKYRAADSIPGFEVLVAKPDAAVFSVWTERDDVRLLIQQRGTSEAKLPEWLSLASDTLGGPAQSPPSFAPIDLKTGTPDKMKLETQRLEAVWALTTADAIYRIGDWNGKSGLWRCPKDQAPVLLLEGNVASPILTPDGKWVVVAKTDTNWAVPNYVVRIQLATGRTYRLDLPAADTTLPVAYAAAHNRILLMRAGREVEPGDSHPPLGPVPPEYRLLDPDTGTTKVVTGEFQPLSDQSIRPLQPAGKANEVWAALYDHDTTTTRFGRYNTQQFTFHPVLSLPMRFSSMQAWADQVAGKLYVAYNGHLLRMDLPRP